ncbi:MAG: FtsX-like permease family protein [Candidatus Sigynarchaeota archaeon]
MTVIGMLGDSISYSYVDYASQSEGKIDFSLSCEGYHWIPTSSIETQIKADPVLATELADFLPREVRGWSGVYEVVETLNPANSKTFKGVYLVGVDIGRENAAVQGKFLLGDGTPFTGTLGDGQCLIDLEMAKKLGISSGQTIIYNLTHYANEQHTIISWTYVRSFTVVAVVNMNFKFPGWIEHPLVINLTQWIKEWVANPPDSFLGYSQTLVINVRNPQLYYDARDIPGTINRLRDIGERIQNRIGFYNKYPWPGGGTNGDLYVLAMPRVSILEIEQYVNVGISIILLFVTILGVVISGVLINGILTTSVEEKIREFGVFRVLGAHRKLPIKLTVLQAFIISSMGTAMGIAGGYAIVRFAFLGLLKRLLDFSAGEVVAYMSAQTLALTIGVGVGVSMIVGIAPALRVSKMSILGAINPYRQESVGTRMVKEGNVNVKLILIGAIASGIAAFVLFIVPQILLTLDIGLIVGVIITLLAVFLLGATLVGLGLLPVIQGIIRRIFTFLAVKTKDIIRISLMRYTRRNVTTVIMFSIAFSFITLVSTVIGTQSAQNVGTIHNNNGADMVFDSRRISITGFNPDSGPTLPDQALARELLSYAEIVKTSTILATDKELGFIRGSTHSITMSDLVNYKSTGVHGVAVDENYLDVVYTQYVIFSQGSQADAFNKLFHNTGYVIVSTAIAGNLMLSVNDKCKVTFEWGDGEVYKEEFTIAGVVDNLPGIPTVEKRPDSASGAAVVFNQADFKRCFQLPAGEYFTSRIFIKLRADYQDLTKSSAFEERLDKIYENKYIFRSLNSFRQGQFAQQIFSIVETLFTVILTFAVIISLFGLTAGAYSTILERTREVGIIETLGLRKRSVKNMFTLESEIIMTSAALNGSVIGLILVALFYWQIAAFSKFPVMSVFAIPYDTIAIELGIAALVCFLSMQGLVKNIQKMELIEIFRKTL